MGVKELSSTKIILEEMRLKSEVMKEHLELMFKAHVQRTLLGERISKGIKARGINYYKYFQKDKERLLDSITEQLKEVNLALEDVRSLGMLFEMLVATEQISLQMENAKARSDASKLIDPESIPLTKYSYDLDQLKILEDSFEVLSIELERQYSYLNNFDFPSSVHDDNIMKQYGYEFSFQGSVNVQNLGSFCDTLNTRLLNHIRAYHKSMNASDIETAGMISELKGIKLDPSVFFSPTIYDMIVKFSRKGIVDRSYESIIFYIITFLLSKLKRYYPHEYYMRIRALLLANDAAPIAGINDMQSDITCMSIIIHSYKKLCSLEKKPKGFMSEEHRIISSYASNAEKILLKQVPHVGLLEDYSSLEEWHTTAQDIAITAMSIDSAYRTVYKEKKDVSYADVSNYFSARNNLMERVGMHMVSRYEFLINPKGHFMSQYFLEPETAYKQKGYKSESKKKGRPKRKASKKR